MTQHSLIIDGTVIGVFCTPYSAAKWIRQHDGECKLSLQNPAEIIRDWCSRRSAACVVMQSAECQSQSDANWLSENNYWAK